MQRLVRLSLWLVSAMGIVGCSPPDYSKSIRLPDDLSDERRQQIIVQRVADDVHDIAKTYPDEKLRTVLETVAAYSGVHPDAIPLDTPLMEPPVLLDAAGVLGVLVTLEKINNVHFSTDTVVAKGKFLTAQDIRNIVPD
jgi:hypothetical protein